MPAPQVADDALSAVLPNEITFVKPIGTGGQRAVYLVEAEGERRVLKLMFEAARERAEREVAIGQNFDHPGLVTILSELFKVEVEGEKCVFFMEQFVDGESLDEIDEMEICEVLDLGADLIAASEYLFADHRLVHRDIKPANIMRRTEGGFVLLDTGVARHQELDGLTAPDAPHGPGTLGYLAPEQLQASKGHELDSRADQFTIAAVMFEQLAGHLPFDPQSGNYRTLLMTGTIGSWDDIPEPLRPLLDRMLQPKAHLRYRHGRATAAIDATKEAEKCS